MSFGLKSVASSIAKSALGERRYMSLNIFEARRMLRGIERVRGKTPRRDIRLCDEYAVEVLGGRRFAPWLYAYSAMAGRFKEGWIPDNFYTSTVVPKVQGYYGAISSLKPLDTVLFPAQVFPDLLSYVNGLFIDTDRNPIAAAHVAARLFADHERVVYKVDRTSGGKAIHFFERKSFDVREVAALGNGLFQAYIKQHDVFDRFYAGAVATLRIATIYKDDGEVSARTCHLRLGNAGEQHVRSKTEIKVAIDLTNGSFGDCGYTADWLQIAAHPASNAVFAGNVVPAFKECIATVVGLHCMFPHTRHVGWDIAVDSDEKVRVMEWNGYEVGIKFSEAIQGPCFADLGWEKLR